MNVALIACAAARKRCVEHWILEGATSPWDYLGVRRKYDEAKRAGFIETAKENKRIWLEFIGRESEETESRSTQSAPQDTQDDDDMDEDWRPLFMRPGFHASDEEREEDKGKYIEAWMPFYSRYARQTIRLTEEPEDELSIDVVIADDEPKPERKITPQLLSRFHRGSYGRRRSARP